MNKTSYLHNLLVIVQIANYKLIIVKLYKKVISICPVWIFSGNSGKK
nr:MAG TPA: hypothetical protein [Caudoviricetes sp.]